MRIAVKIEKYSRVDSPPPQPYITLSVSNEHTSDKVEHESGERRREKTNILTKSKQTVHSSRHYPPPFSPGRIVLFKSLGSV